MGVETFLPGGVVSALERGATVLTGNQRAARTLRRGFDRRNRALGLKRWQPAKVLAWDAWISGWWSRLVMEGQARTLLLNHSQELAVWRGVLEADTEPVGLRSVESLVKMAADAWGLLCSFGGRERLREFSASIDARVFLRWAQGFERRCRAEGFLTRAELEETLRWSLDAGEIAVGSEELVLVGFDGFTPAQSGLIEAMRSLGALIEEHSLVVVSKERVLVEASDEGEELRACAGWVRSFLEGRPEARVGVIVPGLEARRAEIDRVFRSVLAPELEDIAASGGAPYEFSVGVALAATPMVASALDLLDWVKGALPLERVSGLLLSPYFAGGREGLGARAEFDAFVVRKEMMLRPEISLDGVIGLCAKGKWVDALERTLRKMRAAVGRRFVKDDAETHADWAEAMLEFLSAADWGAGEGEDSVEFQVRAKWESALDELATLDFDGRRVKYAEALRELVRIARGTIFAAESREAPVQVLGPLEAAGSQFDAVWFLRAGELSWPARVSTDSLLPWGLQRDLRMPGADGARDAEFSRRVTERIAASAGTVMFSYALESSAGRQRAATVVWGLGLGKRQATEFVSIDEASAALELETLADERAVASLPDMVLRGGAKVLELQAACGFRAFAEYRLWSTELEEIELGMDARESGTAVHRALEQFWSSVQTQEALKAMSSGERMAVLDTAIERGMERAARLSGTDWDAAYVAMQRERLRRLLRPWIAREMERPEFAVRALEQELPEVVVGPLRLSVRVDRVDATAGGDVVIDYKTGRTEASGWLTTRPDAPQLPLYAVVASEEDLAGVAFGVVRAGKNMDWKYVASDPTILGKQAGRPAKMDATTFAGQVEMWRSVLTELATQFAAGDARVAPKWFPQTCERCAHRILCRVNPVEVEEMDDEELMEVGFE